MTHLQTLTKAFDDMGWVYVETQTPDGYTYVILTNEREKHELMAEIERDVDHVLRVERFFEFEPDGSTASY